MKFTAKQEQAMKALTSTATNTLLYGGSGSGKTFLIVRHIVMRACKAALSRHAIVRFRFNHVRQSIGEQTFPAVMQKCFPDIPYELDSRDWFYTLPNGSQIWLGGLDDKERTEKILGHEYVTMFLNECSQIPFQARNVALTRLRQPAIAKVQGKPDQALRPRMLYDCNPPTKGHWAYRLFVMLEDPVSGQPLPYKHDYNYFGPMNPKDNIENLSSQYLQTLESLPLRERKRFFEGQWADANPDALWTEDALERYRIIDQMLPDMQRIIVGVDPSGSGDEDNAGNDEVGIVVVGLGSDGRGYVAEDCSLKAGPATWGLTCVKAFERHNADKIVGEVNFGGAMVGYVIQSCRSESKRRIPFHAVTASRGKVVRAEPIASLFEQGQIRLIGYHPKLEQELLGFSTHGYTGEGSPNRADAMIWACHELFPGLTRSKPLQDSGVVHVAEM